MEKKILVSVIVPIYQVEKYLQQCVDSILQQTYRELEIILVDDGSKDASARICDMYAEKDARVQVIHKENGGLSSARNTGLDIATGEYILFIDSDDWIEVDMVDLLLSNLIKENADISACGFKKEYKDAEETVVFSHQYLVLNTEQGIKYGVMNGYYSIIACNKLVNANLYKGMRFPLGKTSEDYYVTYQLLVRSRKLVYDSREVYHYRMRKGSIGHTKRISHEPTVQTRHLLCFVKRNYPNILDTVLYAYFFTMMIVYNFYINANMRDASRRKRLGLLMSLFAKKYYKQMLSQPLSIKDRMLISIWRCIPCFYPVANNLYRAWKEKKMREQSLFD